MLSKTQNHIISFLVKYKIGGELGNTNVMRKFLLFCLIFLCFRKSIAQIVENPVFDRTDVPAFRVDKVEITPDTTFVYCTYQAETGSWANISPNTYLRDMNTSGFVYIVGWN